MCHHGIIARKVTTIRPANYFTTLLQPQRLHPLSYTFHPEQELKDRENRPRALSKGYNPRFN